MKKLFSNVTLRRQLNFIVFIFGISMVGTVLLFLACFNKITVDRAEIYFNNTSRQLESSVAYTIKNIEASSKTKSRSRLIKDYLKETSIPDKNWLYPYVSNIMNNELSLNNYSTNVRRYIQSISIIDNNGNRDEFYLEDLQDVYSGIEKDYLHTSAGVSTPVFTKGYYSSKKNQYFFAYIDPVFSTENNDSDKKRLGTVVYICGIDIFQELVQQASDSYKSVFLLVDNKNTIFASNDTQLVNHQLKDVSIDMPTYQKHKQVSFNGQQSLTKVIPINQTGWNLIYIVSTNELTKDMEWFKWLAVLIIFSTTGIMFFICMKIIRNCNYQIDSIVSGCTKIGQGSFKYRLKPVGNNEIGTLVEDINRMLDNLEDMTRKIVTTQDQLFSVEIEKRQASINALQSQINPHFLYNTLECIRNIAVAYDSAEIENIAISMAEIFRYSIKGSDVVTIEQELDCIKNYFEIITIRYSGRFTLQLDVEEGLRQKKIIKMILQPLVENAIYHGLEKRNKPGFVHISGYVDNDTIILEVKDNGVGIGENQLQQLVSELNMLETLTQTPSSIGIFNIHNRLVLTYGQEYGLSVTSTVGVGTTVQIRIPNQI
jgi:two-component system, sensor histidine kinase YesM